MNNPVVSIIMPLYNAEKYVEDAIHSVLQQTFSLWELIVVDDCSNDSSYSIVKRLAEQDDRIHLLQTPEPSGSPALPRNIAIKHACGRYIAFLDSDDLWTPTKLEDQLPLFQQEQVTVVFSYYKKIHVDGSLAKSITTSPSQTDYRHLLRGNVIGNLTGIYDTEKVGKHYFIQAGHEDYICWLEILRPGGIALNTQKLHGYYRITKNSLSRNKLKTIQWQWSIYRDIEKISFTESLFCFVCYMAKAFLKSLA